MSQLVNHVNQSLKAAEYQLSVTVYAISMAWVLGFLVPTVALMYS
ncbi:MAG: hypothetical protein Q7K39_00160 [Candidatus Magasanikbacteria bacterium]|nr:hypothetical protein [Candidatus Magasanikbacteria bacterium]